MTERIGKFYTGSDKTRLTPVDFEGERYEVRENYWEDQDEWAVTMEFNDIHRATTTTDVIDYLVDQLQKVELMAGLGYEVDEVNQDSRDTIFWVKSA